MTVLQTGMYFCCLGIEFLEILFWVYFVIVLRIETFLFECWINAICWLIEKNRNIFPSKNEMDLKQTIWVQIPCYWMKPSISLNIRLEATHHTPHNHNVVIALSKFIDLWVFDLQHLSWKIMTQQRHEITREIGLKGRKYWKVIDKQRDKYFLLTQCICTFIFTEILNEAVR